MKTIKILQPNGNEIKEGSLFIRDGKLVKNRCPTCGFEFEENEIQADVFECKYSNCPEKTLILEELITDIEDYLWCI